MHDQVLFYQSLNIILFWFLQLNKDPDVRLDVLFALGETMPKKVQISLQRNILSYHICTCMSWLILHVNRAMTNMIYQENSKLFTIMQLACSNNRKALNLNAVLYFLENKLMCLYSNPASSYVPIVICAYFSVCTSF